jgi:hypothetical protein
MFQYLNWDGIGLIISIKSMNNVTYNKINWIIKIKASQIHKINQRKYIDQSKDCSICGSLTNMSKANIKRPSWVCESRSSI